MGIIQILCQFDIRLSEDTKSGHWKALSATMGSLVSVLLFPTTHAYQIVRQMNSKLSTETGR